jgi:hypothetical protein
MAWPQQALVMSNGQESLWEVSEKEREKERQGEGEYEYSKYKQFFQGILLQGELKTKQYLGSRVKRRFFPVYFLKRENGDMNGRDEKF